jgi:hypothetical protein
MDSEFWVNIVHDSALSWTVEKWQVGEDRILVVERQKFWFKFMAHRHASEWIYGRIVAEYIKEK